CPQPVCISLSAVEDGERLEQQRTVVADVVAAEPVAGVTFLVDGDRVAGVAEPPYQYTFDPALFSDGEHTISVEANAASGETAAAAVDVRVGAAGGGSSNTMLLLLGGGVIIGGGVLALIFLRRRRRGGPDEEPERVPRSAPLPGGEPITRERVRLWDGEERAPLEPAEETLGHIRVTSGPRQGEAFAVGASPVSIGAGHRCRILLKDESGAEEIASEHARVWIREGHLMVHEVRRLTDTGSIGGTWEILEPGDTFPIGTYTFQFVLGDEQSAEPPPQDAPAAIEPPNVLKHAPEPLAVAAAEPPEVAGEAPAPAAAATEPVNIFREKTGRAPVASSEPLPAQAPPDAGEIPNIFKNRPAQQDAPEKNGAPAPDAPSDAGQSSAAL
ncbi:MAG: hypothetical protein HY723_02170, partial [Chloroflexi bacterium]|nr:hypothetical protein [Chloroflexota bacterium]